MEVSVASSHWCHRAFHLSPNGQASTEPNSLRPEPSANAWMNQPEEMSLYPAVTVELGQATSLPTLSATHRHP